MKTKLFSLFVALLATTAQLAYGFWYDGLWYYVISEEDKTAWVTSYFDSNGDNYKVTSVDLPSFVTDEGTTYTVTGIDGRAFVNCTNLTSITIPNSVTSIGEYAFDGCINLTSITIPNSVTSIREYAFSNCTSLTFVAWNARNCKIDDSWSSPFSDSPITSFTFGDEVESIPAYLCNSLSNITSITILNSVTSIGSSAFYGCTGLTSVEWNARNCKIDDSGSSPFSDSPITSFSFGEEVESIPEYLCSELSNITSATIPNSVTSIGSHAFFGCTGLTSVTIGNGVTSIGDDAFSGCTSLTSITIPNSVTSIGSEAFFGCTGLTSVTIPNSVTSIGSSAFSGCTGLTSIIIPDSVTSIGSYAFYGCTGLTSVTMGDSITGIGESAFEYCTSLTSITIPNSVTSIKTRTFWSCTGLTSVTIPNGVTSIEWGAFYDCTGLTSVTIPNSVMSIGGEAFSGCTGLTSITIPNSVTSIGFMAFSGCTDTSIIVESGNTTYDSRDNCNAIIETTTNTLVQGCNTTIIPNSITSIGDYAFYSCTGLTSISIPNSVKSIGEGAFYYCTGLTSVVIGNNNELNIGAQAFSDCENLMSVTCYANVPPIIIFDEYEGEREGAFETDRLSLMRLYVPAKAISQYNEAEQWKDFGRIAPIGATTIDTDDEQPVAEPSFAEVTITWKITPNAETYTIAITRGTETVCTLVFNADGQLTNIAFAAPSRKGTPRHAPAAVMTEQGYQFTVTGLESGTQYGYTLSVKDSNGKELQNYAGTFTTKGESTAIGNPSADNTTDQLKVIRNGQVYILRGGKMYTLTGVVVE